MSDTMRTMPYDMAKRLVDAGGDPTIRGWMQMSAIDRAARRLMEPRT